MFDLYNKDYSYILLIAELAMEKTKVKKNYDDFIVQLEDKEIKKKIHKTILSNQKLLKSYMVNNAKWGFSYDNDVLTVAKMTMEGSKVLTEKLEFFINKTEKDIYKLQRQNVLPVVNYIKEVREGTNYNVKRYEYAFKNNDKKMVLQTLYSTSTPYKRQFKKAESDLVELF